MYKPLMSNFLKFSHTKNHKNRLIFGRVIRKIKRWTFFWDTVQIFFGTTGTFHFLESRKCSYYFYFLKSRIFGMYFYFLESSKVIYCGQHWLKIFSKSVVSLHHSATLAQDTFQVFHNTKHESDCAFLHKFWLQIRIHNACFPLIMRPYRSGFSSSVHCKQWFSSLVLQLTHYK